MLRLTGTERAVAEVAAVAEHVASLTAAAAAFRLPADVPSAAGSGAMAPLVEPPGGRPESEAAPVLDEIRQWMHDVLGIDHVPAIWRTLAHQPRLLEATWRKDQLVMSAGTLDDLVKGCAALAVAEFRQSDYWIPYYTHLLRTRSGLDDRAIVEVAGAVMHYVSFNTIAHGMRLEPPVSDLIAADVIPGGPLEHVVPGARRRPASRTADA